MKILQFVCDFLPRSKILCYENYLYVIYFICPSKIRTSYTIQRRRRRYAWSQNPLCEWRLCKRREYYTSVQSLREYYTGCSARISYFSKAECLFRRRCLRCILIVRASAQLSLENVMYTFECQRFKHGTILSDKKITTRYVVHMPFVTFTGGSPRHVLFFS